jgi:plasmid stability protein
MGVSVVREEADSSGRIMQRRDSAFATTMRVPEAEHALSVRAEARSYLRTLGKREEQRPRGMTERKAKANATEEADPYGMTARKTTATAKIQGSLHYASLRSR